MNETVRIRTELPAQCIRQLPSIEILLTHLKGKGRKPATLEAIGKGLKALVDRTLNEIQLSISQKRWHNDK